MRKTLVAALVGLGLAAPAACGGYGKYCDAWVDCLNGNDDDRTACDTWLVTEEDRASLYGCDDLFEERQACWESQSRCESAGGVPLYVTCDVQGGNNCRCDDEEERYHQCMQD
ncbi:MAG: hypothetical protein HY908_23895 [Myxococcales bacterium]|nr:hypothetical protein [Myxococcales bacterium]